MDSSNCGFTNSSESVCGSNRTCEDGIGMCNDSGLDDGSGFNSGK